MAGKITRQHKRHTNKCMFKGVVSVCLHACVTERGKRKEKKKRMWHSEGKRNDPEVKDKTHQHQLGASSVSHRFSIFVALCFTHDRQRLAGAVWLYSFLFFFFQLSKWSHRASAD